MEKYKSQNSKCMCPYSRFSGSRNDHLKVQNHKCILLCNRICRAADQIFWCYKNFYHSTHLGTLHPLAKVDVCVKGACARSKRLSKSSPCSTGSSKTICNKNRGRPKGEVGAVPSMKSFTCYNWENSDCIRDKPQHVFQILKEAVKKELWPLEDHCLAKSRSVPRAQSMVMLWSLH